MLHSGSASPFITPVIGTKALSLQLKLTTFLHVASEVTKTKVLPPGLYTPSTSWQPLPQNMLLEKSLIFAVLYCQNSTKSYVQQPVLACACKWHWRCIYHTHCVVLDRAKARHTEVWVPGLLKDS